MTSSGLAFGHIGDVGITEQFGEEERGSFLERQHTDQRPGNGQGMGEGGDMIEAEPAVAGLDQAQVVRGDAEDLGDLLLAELQLRPTAADQVGEAASIVTVHRLNASFITYQVGFPGSIRSPHPSNMWLRTLL